ncbi:MAG: hypothetical protein JWM85_2982 [Acidimicrobiaceae bacterium]|nr:hypothetical protein [Acidimicrobiaceae bacterium]
MHQGESAPGPVARHVPSGRPGRPTVAVVTTHWGTGDDESTAVTRLFAGALSRTAEVEVVHLISPPGPVETVTDSVFRVHRVPIHGARPLRSGILRAALAAGRPAAGLPSQAHALIEHLEGDAPDVPEILAGLGATSVVLAGHHQPWDLSALPRSGAGPRVVVLPFLGDSDPAPGTHLLELLEHADAIGVVHPGEERTVRRALAARPSSEVVALRLAFPLNRGATRHRLFGVRWFGRYIVTIRSFPTGGPRYLRSVTHEVLRSVIGNVSVAEVDAGAWRISDAESTLALPVSPSRVNLWRLMAHAVATIDLRPAGPVGREALESMLLGTPVLVPEGSASMEHAAAANGGLWYRDIGELFDSARALMSRPLRDRLSEQGEAYTTANHSGMDGFVERAASLVLGR